MYKVKGNEKRICRYASRVKGKDEGKEVNGVDGRI